MSSELVLYLLVPSIPSPDLLPALSLQSVAAAEVDSTQGHHADNLPRPQWITGTGQLPGVKTTPNSQRRSNLQSTSKHWDESVYQQ